MHEEEKIARARRQLIIIGVACVAAVVFLLWVLSLRRTLDLNRAQYSSPFSSIKETFTRELKQYAK